MHSLRKTSPLITTHLTRTLTTTPPKKMSLFPRFTQDFAPLFRLVDDYDRALRTLDSPSTHNPTTPWRSFTPKFDIKETPDAYELHGEIPGVLHKDVSIEWTDNNTLTVSGRHEYVREEGRRPGAVLEGADSRARIEGGEKADVQESAAAMPSADGKVEDIASAAAGDADVDAAPQTRYWVSERSVGSFQRSFAFPARVDQDAVRASLKNGILSIAVPKAAEQAKKQVTIETE